MDSFDTQSNLEFMVQMDLHITRGWDHPHSHRLSNCTCQPQTLPPLAAVQSLNFCETLQQSYNYIARLGKRQLLPDANPRTAVERQELPTGAEVIPALRPEFVGVRAPEILPPVHHVDGVSHILAFSYMNGVFSLGSLRYFSVHTTGMLMYLVKRRGQTYATDWECYVAIGLSSVQWDIWP